MKVANTREGNVGRHTLSQDLGPLYRLQGCGSVDRQCDLEVLCHSTQVVIKTSKMARHISIIQCGHPAQARKGERSPRCIEPKTPTYSGVCGRDETSKRSSTSKPPGCICQRGEAQHSKWSQVPLPFAKLTLCVGREDKGHHFEGMS